MKHEGYNVLAGNPAYNYKYNGKELQKETGWLDYGWRQYMPDLGRWTGIDQLAESYLSTSPYAYVANNPVSQFDVDGRWMDDNGHIDTSGNANPFRDLGRTRSLMSQFAGHNPGEGSGGGYTFTGKDAVTMFSYFKNGGNFDGLSFKNGYMSWWTGGALGDANTAQEMVGHMMKFQDKTLSDSYFDGFVGGAQSSWNYIKGQFFGESYWNGLANTFTLGAYGTVKTINSLIDATRNIPNYTANDYSYGAGYLTEKAAEAIILKEASQINPFGIRGGYGVFGKNGLKIGGYKVEALYGNGPGVPGGTIFSVKSNIQGGNLLRWDYGIPHANPTGSIGIHSHFRFIIGGSTYGSSAQYPWHAPFNYWNYKK